MKTILSVLLWIWQCPQNVVGLVLRHIYRNRTGAIVNDRGIRYYIVPDFPGGISLGSTIITRYYFLQNSDSWDHEYGHTRQSLYLGPLYLFVIGIPSLLWAWWWHPGRNISYYSFYTEKWADKLGKVKRQ